MAYDVPCFRLSGVEAAEDLSAKQYLFAVMGANGISGNTTAGGVTAGIILNNPANIGEPVTVEAHGISRCISGAAVAKGALVMSDAAGKGVTATAGNFFRGIALEAASKADVVFTVLLAPTGYVPTP